MSARRRFSHPRRRGNQLIALAMLLAVGLVTYFSFHPQLPFAQPYELDAVVRDANQLRGGAPVRIAGVEAGKVTSIGTGPVQGTATVHMEIDDSALPIHSDATLRIRPRIFLEGGYYVELHPGTPTGRQLDSGGTLPLPQTATPVEFTDLLSTFAQPIRSSFRTTLKEFDTGLAGGGAEGLREVAPELAPTLRDLAIVAQAAQGERPDEVTRIVSYGSRLTAALARSPQALGGLVSNFRGTADALAARDADLADSVTELDALMRDAPTGLAALDGTLPVARRVVTEARPALRVAPASLKRTVGVVNELGTLVAPGVRERTVAGLATTFVDLPTLVTRMAALFPSTKSLADCLDTHIVPNLKSVVPDGDLSSGRPVWQDFAHSVVGLASATQNFDGNGYSTRYEFGAGPQGLVAPSLPGIGTLRGSSSGPLRSRPVPLPGRKAPALRTDVPCTSQKLPSLETPVGDAGLGGGGGGTP